MVSRTRTIKDNLKIVQAGLDRIVYKDNGTEADTKAIKDGWELAKKAIQNKEYQLIILDEANIAIDLNIITVEDPVEMKMKGLNQVQVMREMGLDFNATLRSILRQDPDTIMIGEIRDGETARIAVRASITGHLVLSTIHTNNSLNTIERLLDMDVERYLLGTSLNGIISQRLCKGLCPKCKKKRPTTAYEKNLFSKVIHQDVAEIYEPVGCDECFGGYKSRIAVHEVLILNQEIRDGITNNMRKEDLRKIVYNGKDTLTLLEDGLQKVLDGKTSFDEILKFYLDNKKLNENSIIIVEKEVYDYYRDSYLKDYTKNCCSEHFL